MLLLALLLHPSPALAVLGQLPFGDYMTPKDAGILLGPSRIPADSEVTKVFMEVHRVGN